MRVEDMTDAELALAPHRMGGPVAVALLDAAAVSEAQAIRYVPTDAGAATDLARHRAAGTVQITADGRCWLDIRRWYFLEARRARRRAMIAAAIALVLAVVATLFFRG